MATETKDMEVLNETDKKFVFHRGDVFYAELPIIAGGSINGDKENGSFTEDDQLNEYFVSKCTDANRYIGRIDCLCITKSGMPTYVFSDMNYATKFDKSVTKLPPVLTSEQVLEKVNKLAGSNGYFIVNYTRGDIIKRDLVVERLLRISTFLHNNSGEKYNAYNATQSNDTFDIDNKNISAINSAVASYCGLDYYEIDWNFAQLNDNMRTVNIHSFDELLKKGNDAVDNLLIAEKEKGDDYKSKATIRRTILKLLYDKDFYEGLLKVEDKTEELFNPDMFLKDFGDLLTEEEAEDFLEEFKDLI